MSAAVSGERAPASSDGKASATHRRLTAQRVREARDRLTSTTGTRPAFDYELLRLFAQNRQSASLAVLSLVATIGFLSSLWSTAVEASIWTAAVMMIHGIIVAMCRKFLAEAPGGLDLRAWRMRFVLLDLFFGLAWMLNLVHLVGGDEGSTTFMLFVMLLVVAVSSMLASSLPMAVIAATVPVTTAVALNFVLRGNVHSYILAAMAFTAQGYFAMLAHRLYLHHAGDAGGARREGRADRRARAGQGEVGRGAAPCGGGQSSPSRASSRR